MATALSGSKTQTFTNNSSFSLILKWSATQNIAGNKSSVKVELQLKSNASWGVLSGISTRQAYITINGSVGGKTNVNLNIGANATKSLMTRTIDVAHDADGNKSFTISANLNFGVYWHGQQVNDVGISTSAYLKQIPRASVPTLNKSTVEMGQPVVIDFHRATGSFTHKVTYTFGTDTTTLTENAGANFTFTPAVSKYAPIIKNAANGYGSINVTTKNGSTTIGSTQSIKLTLTLPSSVVPSLSAKPALSNTNTTITSLLGITQATNVFLAGKSSIRFVITAGMAYSSPIKEYKIVIAGKTFTSSTNTIDVDLSKNNLGTGNVAFKVSATDQRGRTKTIDKDASNVALTVPIQAYSPPSLSALTATRQAAPNETKVNINRTGTVSSIKNGTAEINPYTIKTEYRLSGIATWTPAVATTVKEVFGVLALSNFDVTKSYDVRVTVTDKLSSTVSTTTVSTSTVLFHMYKDTAIGIGHLTNGQKGVLDVKGEVFVEGGIRMSNNGVFWGNPAIEVFDADNYGGLLKLAGGGMTVVGAGESPEYMATNYKKLGFTSNTEDLFLLADSDVMLYAGANDWESKGTAPKVAVFKGSDGHFNFPSYTSAIGYNTGREKGTYTCLVNNNWRAMGDSRNMYIEVQSATGATGQLIVCNKANTNTLEGIKCKSANTSSGHSIKKDFSLLSITEQNALERLRETDVVDFKFKDESESQTGFIINDDEKSPFKINSHMHNSDNETFNINNPLFNTMQAVKELDYIVKKQSEEIQELKAALSKKAI